MSIRPVFISEYDALVDPESRQGAPEQVYRTLGGKFGPVEGHISWSAGQMFGHLPMASLTRRIPKPKKAGGFSLEWFSIRTLIGFGIRLVRDAIGSFTNIFLSTSLLLVYASISSHRKFTCLWNCSTI